MLLKKMFKNKYGEIRGGWPLLVGVVLPFLGATMPIGNSDYAGIVRRMFMIAGIFLLFWLFYKRPFRHLGLYRKHWERQLALGALFGAVSVLLLIALLCITGTIRLTDFNLAGFADATFWSGLFLFLFIAFFEELLCRGYMMTVLKTTRSKWVIVLVPAVIFSLLHISDGNATLLTLVNVALVALLFTYMFIKTGKLWLCIGFHFAWNFLESRIIQDYNSVSQTPLVHATFTGPNWMTGGAFGLEGSIICTLVILLGFVFVRFCIKPFGKEEKFWSIDSDMPLTRNTSSTHFLQNPK